MPGTSTTSSRPLQAAAFAWKPRLVVHTIVEPTGHLEYVAITSELGFSPLLLVVLNHAYLADGRAFRIEACPSFRSPLTKQVPALIEMLFDLAPSLSVGFAWRLLALPSREIRVPQP